MDLNEQLAQIKLDEQREKTDYLRFLDILVVTIITYIAGFNFAIQEAIAYQEAETKPVPITLVINEAEQAAAKVTEAVKEATTVGEIKQTLLQEIARNPELENFDWLTPIRQLSLIDANFDEKARTEAIRNSERVSEITATLTADPLRAGHKITQLQGRYVPGQDKMATILCDPEGNNDLKGNCVARTEFATGHWLKTFPNADDVLVQYFNSSTKDPEVGHVRTLVRVDKTWYHLENPLGPTPVDITAPGTLTYSPKELLITFAKDETPTPAHYVAYQSTTSPPLPKAQTRARIFTHNTQNFSTMPYKGGVIEEKALEPYREYQGPQKESKDNRRPTKKIIMPPQIPWPLTAIELAYYETHETFAHSDGNSDVKLHKLGDYLVTKSLIALAQIKDEVGKKGNEHELTTIEWNLALDPFKEELNYTELSPEAFIEAINSPHLQQGLDFVRGTHITVNIAIPYGLNTEQLQQLKAAFNNVKLGDVAVVSPTPELLNTLIEMQGGMGQLLLINPSNNLDVNKVNQEFGFGTGYVFQGYGRPDRMSKILTEKPQLDPSTKIFRKMAIDEFIETAASQASQRTMEIVGGPIAFTINNFYQNGLINKHPALAFKIATRLLAKKNKDNKGRNKDAEIYIDSPEMFFCEEFPEAELVELIKLLGPNSIFMIGNKTNDEALDNPSYKGNYHKFLRVLHREGIKAVQYEQSTVVESSVIIK